jgi:predicted secreted hydrolase
MNQWPPGSFIWRIFALSDISGNIFYFDEKIFRGAAGLAGAQAEPLRVWVENWELTGDYTGKKSMPEMKIKAQTDDFGIEFKLIPQKDIVLHGVSGLSPKSSDPENASYYYSHTRLKTSGKVTIEGEDFVAAGFSWMDREWSTSALTRRQAGWDWFSVQLDNNSEIMYFKLRDKSGNIDFSKGTIVYPDGTYEYLPGEKFSISETAFWENETGQNIPRNGFWKSPKKILSSI